MFFASWVTQWSSHDHTLCNILADTIYISLHKGESFSSQKLTNKITKQHMGAMWRWHFIAHYWISSFTQREKPCIKQLLQWWNHHRRVETERERTVPSNLTARRWRFAVPKLPITEKVQEAECPSWSKPIVASYQGPFSICSPKTANSRGLFTAWSIAFLHKDTRFKTSQTS
jgi:hypothetical protein